MSIADPELTAAAAQMTRFTRLYEDLREHELEAQWCIEPSALPFEPAPRAWTWLWQGRELEALACRAGALVGVERSGNHRALACINPGLRERTRGRSTARRRRCGPRWSTWRLQSSRRPIATAWRRCAWCSQARRCGPPSTASAASWRPAIW